MKTLHFILISTLVVLLGACAGTQTSPEATDTGEVSEADAYIDAVQIQADRTGADVHWVNPPKDKDKDKK